jgi:hypothetical protein
MPTTLALVFISSLLGAVAMYQSDRHRRYVAARRGPQHSASRARAGQCVSTLVRDGHVGDAALGSPVRTLSRVAPADAPTKVLESFVADGTVHTSVSTDDVVMVRVWSRGRLVLASGETRREYGPAWALGPAMAGWEIHVVDTSGGVVRCYGGPGTSIDDDLARLQTRIPSVALASAG